MTELVIYTVPGMTCDHCANALVSELSSVAGVAGVEVDLASKAVTITGEGLDDAALRGAIDDAGYEALK